MKISMDLSKKSILQAAKALKEYAKRLKQADDEISARLSEIAADEAMAHFDSEIMVTAGNHGVTASGYSVVFQEFGAGSMVRDPYDGGADVSFEIRRGAYSDLHEGEYARSGYEMWHHDGEEYRYVTPVNGLFHGMMKAREEAAEVAKEVLEGS